VIKVNWNKYRTAQEMAEMIKREYVKMRLINYIDFDKPNA